jgi:hypothetical protein
MIRMMLGGAAGFALGYSICRAAEARVNKVPLDYAFKLSHIGIPTSLLRERILAASAQQKAGELPPPPSVKTAVRRIILQSE